MRAFIDLRDSELSVPARIEKAFAIVRADLGLARSNYYADWTDTIRNIDPHLAGRILDKIAPKRRQT